MLGGAVARGYSMVPCEPEHALESVTDGVFGNSAGK